MQGKRGRGEEGRKAKETCQSRSFLKSSSIILSSPALGTWRDAINNELMWSGLFPHARRRHQHSALAFSFPFPLFAFSPLSPSHDTPALPSAAPNWASSCFWEPPCWACTPGGPTCSVSPSPPPPGTLSLAFVEVTGNVAHPGVYCLPEAAHPGGGLGRRPGRAGTAPDLDKTIASGSRVEVTPEGATASRPCPGRSL